MSQWQFFNPPKINTLNSISGLLFDESVSLDVALTSTNLVVVMDYLNGTDAQVEQVKEHRTRYKLPLKIILDYSFESGTSSNIINAKLDTYAGLGIDMSNVLLFLNNATHSPKDYNYIKCQYELVDLFALSAVIRYTRFKHPVSTTSVVNRPLMLNLLIGKLEKSLRSETIYQFYKNGLFDRTRFGILGTIRELRRAVRVRDSQFFSDVVPYLKPFDNVISFSTDEGKSSEGWSGSCEIYDSTSVSYVCETHDNISYPNVTSTFITEKTYRPIINRHPFVIQSTAGFLENLHKKGFITFSKYIDESYDNYTSLDPTRVSNLVNTANSLLKAVPKYSSEIQSIVNHNARCLTYNATIEQRRVRKIIENFLK